MLQTIEELKFNNIFDITSGYHICLISERYELRTIFLKGSNPYLRQILQMRTTAGGKKPWENLLRRYRSVNFRFSNGT